MNRVVSHGTSLQDLERPPKSPLPRQSLTRGFATVASLYHKEAETPDEVAGREVCHS